MPFFGALFKEWEVTESYVIKGTINTVATDFIYFDFISEHGIEDDIALRLSVRFSENKVYRQSLVGGEWKAEETDGAFPFALGQEFELEVVAEQDHWNILVNKQVVWTYTYTLELSRVLSVHVEGPVTIISITPGGKLYKLVATMISIHLLIL